MKIGCLFFYLLLSVQASEFIIETHEKVYAIGDTHGDLERTQSLLRGLGLIDEKNRWMGGKQILVQVGDQVDRWYEDRKTLDYFDQLKSQARFFGGDVLSVIGNHEIKNTLGNMIKLPREAMLPFQEFNPLFKEIDQSCIQRYLKRKNKYISSANPHSRYLAEQYIEELETAGMLGRVASFCPGNRYANLIAKRPMAVIVNDLLFVHGGFEKKYSQWGRKGIAILNGELRQWFQGEHFQPKFHKNFIEDFLDDDHAPFESRLFAKKTDKMICQQLDQVLKDLKVKRMIVGHTVQNNGITSACDGKIIRIDVGFSRGYLLENKFYLPRNLQALELTKNTFKIRKIEDQYRNKTQDQKLKEDLIQTSFSCQQQKTSNSYMRCPLFISNWIIDSIFHQEYQHTPWSLQPTTTSNANPNYSCTIGKDQKFQVFFSGQFFSQENELCHLQIP